MVEKTNNPTKETKIDRSFSILVADSSPFLGQKISDILSLEKSVSWVVYVNQRTELLQKAAELHPDFVLADLSILKTPQTVDLLRQATHNSLLISMIETQSAPYAKVTNDLGLDGMIEKGRIGRGWFCQILRLSQDKQISCPSTSPEQTKGEE